MISKKEVEKIAKLARLELTEQETEKMQKDLSEILDYFDLLKSAPKPKANYSNIPRNNGIANLNATRTDEVLPRNAGTVDRLMAGFPDKKDGYIKVKAVL
ncbi:MAG: Asp-tRNA(Asn)/Glu-tRNA(Gln) amidotransferase subunit GatC [Candidatus Staskawiczbacteria bacterium]|jgi:aspartyl-tRNA(Asn)/glutamyl-tRNA(Gln) amidotransferase subunit C